MTAEIQNIPIIPSNEVSNDKILKKINHATYVSLIKLYKVICNYKGIIFGGAVRDYVKRILAVEKFREYCSKNKLNFNESYNDENIYPETFKDRTILPADIDIHITEENYKKLIEELNKNYDIKVNEHIDITPYLFDSHELLKDAIIFKKAKINFIRKKERKIFEILLGDDIIDFNNFNIKIDFIIIKNEFTEHYEFYDGGLLYPPFGTPDFDVNLLYMFLDKDNNISIDVLNEILYKSHLEHTEFSPFKRNNKKYEILQLIYKNIENSVALPIYPNLRNNYTDIRFQPKIDIRRLRM